MTAIGEGFQCQRAHRDSVWDWKGWGENRRSTLRWERGGRETRLDRRQAEVLQV